MGTRAGIAAIGGRVIEGAKLEVDAAAVGGEVESLTERDFYFRRDDEGEE